MKNSTAKTNATPAAAANANSKTWSHLAENARLEVSGDTLTITVDLKKNSGPSASGKSLTVATTRGNINLPTHPGIALGLNVYKSIR